MFATLYTPRIRSQADPLLGNYQRAQLHRLVVLLVLLALVLRLLWVLAIDTQPFNDERWYYAAAIGIAAGDDFRWHGPPDAWDGELTAFWPVGYSAFLAGLFVLFGESVVVAEAANVVLSLGIAVCAAGLAWRWFSSPVVALFTLLLLAVSPTQIAYTTNLLSEILMTFLLLLGLLLLTNRHAAVNTLAAGVVLALASLTKSQLLLVPFVWLATVCLFERGKTLWQRLLGLLRRAVPLGVVMLLVLAPWILRNYHVFGRFIPVSSMGGLALYIGNGPHANGGSPDMSAVAADVDYGVNSEIEANDAGMRLALDYIRSNPAAVLALLPRKVWEQYRPDTQALQIRRQDMLQQTGEAGAGLYAALRGVSIIFYCAVMGAGGLYGLLALWRAARRRWHTPQASPLPLVPGILAIALYFTVLALVFHGEPRYRFPYMPLLTMYAAALLALLLNPGSTLRRVRAHRQESGSEC